MLSFAEQDRLFQALNTKSKHRQTNESREYLRQLLVFLIDTAARNGEAKQLERRDIDLEMGLITLRAPTTKTERKRQIPFLNGNLRDIIEQRLSFIPHNPHALVFGNVNVKKCFGAAASEHRLRTLEFAIVDIRRSLAGSLRGCDSEAMKAVAKAPTGRRIPNWATTESGSNYIMNLKLLTLILLMSLSVSAQTNKPSRRMAVTIDDLPYVDVGERSLPGAQRATKKSCASCKRIAFLPSRS